LGWAVLSFALPLLIAVFALYPHRAVPINLLISHATLGMSATSRLSFVHATSVTDYKVEIGGMLAGGMIAAWLGAGYLSRIPKSRTMGVIAVLLLGTAGLLAVETGISGTVWILLAQDSAWHAPAAVIAGLLVGTISSLLGVAGGEFIIPILIFVFGVEIERPARRVC